MPIIHRAPKPPRLHRQPLGNEARFGLIAVFIGLIAIAVPMLTQAKPGPAPVENPNVLIYSTGFKSFTTGSVEVTGFAFGGTVENKTGEPIQIVEFNLRLAGKLYPTSYAAAIGDTCPNSPVLNLEPDERKEVTFFVSLPMTDMNDASGDYFEPVLAAGDSRGRSWNLLTVNENVSDGSIPSDPCYNWPK